MRKIGDILEIVHEAEAKRSCCPRVLETVAREFGIMEVVQLYQTRSEREVLQRGCGSGVALRLKASCGGLTRWLEGMTG